MVKIIVAVGELSGDGRGFPIGKDGKTPWHNKADIKWFKDTTTGHPVIMGRKTFEAIGHPLPKRLNIVVTSDKTYEVMDGIKAFPTLERAIDYARLHSDEKSIDGDVFIIGGASLYNYALEHDLVDEVLMDMLAERVEDADAFFPNILMDKTWLEVGQTIEIDKRKAYVLTYSKCRGFNNHVDEQYLKLVNRIIKEGEHKDTRAGKTRSIFGVQMRFNLQEGLPMLTTKKMFAKGVIHELLWFLKGDTNIKYLVDNGVHIWDDDAYRYFCEVWKKNTPRDTEPISKEEFLRCVQNGDATWLPFMAEGKVTYFKYTFGDLGPVYGKQWRDWGGVDQIKEVVEKLKTNPDDRRLMVSAWNVGEIKDMALPPCHYCCQFWTKEMTIGERQQWVIDNQLEFKLPDDFFHRDLGKLFDEWGVPRRKLSCMWNQRSVDTLLGLPFNILSYSILTHLVAQCCNMVPDELIFNGGDVHVYENQIEIYEKEQKERNSQMYALPKLVLKPVKEIDKFTYEDIKIEGYKSYPSVKYPLSVG